MANVFDLSPCGSDAKLVTSIIQTRVFTTTGMLPIDCSNVDTTTPDSCNVWAQALTNLSVLPCSTPPTPSVSGFSGQLSGVGSLSSPFVVVAGVTQSGTVQPDGWVYYKLSVDEASEVYLSCEGSFTNSSNLDFYLRQGSVPSAVDFDEFSSGFNGYLWLSTTGDPLSGDFYLAVHSSSSVEVTYSLALGAHQYSLSDANRVLSLNDEVRSTLLPSSLFRFFIDVRKISGAISLSTFVHSDEASPFESSVFIKTSSPVTLGDIQSNNYLYRLSRTVYPFDPTFFDFTIPSGYNTLYVAVVGSNVSPAFVGASAHLPTFYYD